MRYLPILLVFVSTNLFAQNYLDFQEFKEDTNFICNNQINIIHQIGKEYNGHSTGLKLICLSKSEIEFRLFVSHRPSSSWDLFVLTYGNNIWSATKYSFSRGKKSFDTLNPITATVMNPKYGFDTLFSNLKINHVFTLPDQGFLTSDYLVNDGNIYFMTIKAGNKYRQFYFENPSHLKEKFKSIHEFIYLENIVSIFYEDLQHK